MKQSHQNSALFCESDLYALMQPDVRKRLALSDEVDFPALRGQFHGENLPEIYRNCPKSRALTSCRCARRNSNCGRKCGFRRTANSR